LHCYIIIIIIVIVFRVDFQKEYLLLRFLIWSLTFYIWNILIEVVSKLMFLVSCCVAYNYFAVNNFHHLL
jgi:hypothetical protein